jgi:hypothetical protein
VHRIVTRKDFHWGHIRQRSVVRTEGDNLINGWPQMGAGDLLGEAVIAITLSGLAEQADAAGKAAV